MNGRTDASTRDKPAWRKSATANVNTNPENALDGRSRFRRMRSRLNAEETDRPLTISPLAQSNSVRLLFVCIDRSHSKRGHLSNKLLENCRDPCLFFHNILNVKPGTRWPLYTIVNQKFFGKFSTFGWARPQQMKEIDCSTRYKTASLWWMRWKWLRHLLITSKCD